MKNSFLLCALLSSSFSLSASWKQRIYSALPRIALATQFANQVVTPLAESFFTLKDVQKNAHEYANDSATEYVTKILRDRKVIEVDKTVRAQWGIVFASYNDAFIMVPERPETLENYGPPEMCTLHEEGHRQSQDCEKRLIASGAFETIFYGLGTFVARKAILATSINLYESLGRTVCASHIPMVFMRFMSTPLFYSYCRDQERKADRFSMRYAKNPEELAQMAAWYQKRHETFLEKTYNQCPLAIAIEQIKDTHPPDLERAQYFQKAADELRAKQKSA